MKKTETNENYSVVATAITQAISSFDETLVKGQTPVFLDCDGKRVEIRTHSETPVDFSLSVRKLFDYIMLLVTKKINEPGDWTDEKVHFTLADYMSIMGYMNDQLMCNQCYTVICDDSLTLGGVTLIQESEAWFGLITSFRFISGKNAEGSEEDTVDEHARFELGVQSGLLEHVRRDGRIIQFPSEHFKRLHDREAE